MMRSLLAAIAFCICSYPVANAQTHCTAKDKEKCESLLLEFSKTQYKDLPVQQLVLAVGKQFMGTPYVAKTLDIEGEERLVMDLHGLDCTTYLENVLVFSMLIMQQNLTFEAFQETLTTIRYRGGAIDAYPSRLHYFTEWIYDNQKKGIIKDVSKEVGGIPYRKPLDFMSNHRDSYAQLSNDTYYAAIQGIEKEINARAYPYHYIPKASLAKLEKNIQDGDLISITTTLKGLDVVHTGFAIHHQGRLHMLHASSRNKKVEISQKPLADYLAGNKIQSGIIVCRILDK